MKGIGDRIRQCREALGLSQAALANLIEIDQSAVALWETDKTTPRPGKIDALTRILHTSREYLLLGTVAAGALDQKTVPIVGCIVANDEVRFFPSKAVHHIAAPPSNGEAIGGAVVVHGDALWPTYGAGDIIFFSARSKDPDECVGIECLVESDDGKMRLKRINAGRSKGRWTLSSLRTPDLLDIGISRCLPVLWVQRGASR